MTIQNGVRTWLRRRFLKARLRKAVSAAGNQWRKVQWPKATKSTDAASNLLKKMYMKSMALKYRKFLKPERKTLLELKSLAHDLFSAKKSYRATYVP
jgi:hypothetical protein